MELNFEAASQPITEKELLTAQTAAEKDARRTEKGRTRLGTSRALPEDGIVFVKGTAYKSKPRRNKKAKQQEEEREKMLKGVKVRKYAKEMQNRDAIAKKSRNMKKKAKRTKWTHDDKFAESAAASSGRFDDIIYGSATSEDAAESIEAGFEKACNCSQQQDENQG